MRQRGPGLKRAPGGFSGISPKKLPSSSLSATV